MFISQLVDNITTEITRDDRYYLPELNGSFTFLFGPQTDCLEPQVPLWTLVFSKWFEVLRCSEDSAFAILPLGDSFCHVSTLRLALAVLGYIFVHFHNAIRHARYARVRRIFGWP